MQFDLKLSVLRYPYSFVFFENYPAPDNLDGGGSEEGSGYASLQRRTMVLCAFSHQKKITLDPPPSTVKVGRSDHEEVVIVK